MAGRTFEELVGSGALAPSGFGRPLDNTNTEFDSGRAAADAYDKMRDAEMAAADEKRKKLVALFGTSDPVKAAKMQATGAFDKNLAQRMLLDPDGTKAQVDRAVALAGKGGVQDAAPIMEGVGEHGERYFTNRPEGELYAEHAPVRGLQPGPTPSGALKPFEDHAPGGTISSGDEQSPEEILFEGRLDKARQIAETPERQAKHAADVEKYGQEILQLGHDEDVTTARQKVSDDLVSGALLKRGIKPKEASAIDKILIKRAKTTLELANPGVDRTFYMPWHKSAKKPGQAADPAEPATILNPGGQAPASTKVNQANLAATNDLVQHVNDTAGTELPRTFQYATPGKLSEGASGETDEPRSDIGKFFSSLNERRKRAQRDAEARGYDPNAQSDIGKLLGF